MAERVLVSATIRFETGQIFRIDVADADLFAQWAAYLIRSNLTAGRYTIDIQMHVLDDR